MSTLIGVGFILLALVVFAGAVMIGAMDRLEEMEREEDDPRFI